MRETGVSVLVKLIDGVTAPMRKVTGNFATLRHAAEHSKELFEFGAHSQLAGAGMNEAAEKLTEAVAQPVEVAESFERAMLRVTARTHATAAHVHELEEAMHGLYASPTQAAGAMERLAQSGRSVEEILQMINPIAQVAKIDQADLGQTARNTSVLMKLFSRDAEQTGQTLDVLAAGANKGGVGVNELIEMMTRATEAGGAMGVSLEEITALMADMASAGRDGGRAGATLQAVFDAFAKTPSKDVAADFARIGLQTTGKNPIELLGEMWSKTEDVPAAKRLALFDEVFGQQAGAVAEQLARDVARGAIRSMTDELGRGKGTVASQFAAMFGGGPNAAERLSFARERTQIAEGSSLSPVVGRATDWWTQLVDGLGKVADANPRATGAVMGTVGALGFLAKSIVMVVGGIGFLATGVGVITAGLGVEATGVQLLGGAMKAVGTIAGGIAGTVGAVAFALVGVGAAAYEAYTHWSDLKLLWDEWNAEDKPTLDAGPTAWQRKHGQKQKTPATWTDADEEAYQGKVSAANKAREEAIARAHVTVELRHDKPPRIARVRADPQVTLLTTIGPSLSGG